MVFGCVDTIGPQAGDIARTAVMGRATDRQRDLYARVSEAKQSLTPRNV